MAERITNNYRPDLPRERVDTQSAFLYSPEGPWAYSHHQSVTYHNGRFHAIWSNGRKNEDDVGQRVLMSASRDGLSWESPWPLIDSMAGKHSELVLTAAGFHQQADLLVAYAGAYEYNMQRLKAGTRTRGDMGHEETNLLAVTCTDGGSWGDPVSIELPIVPNHGPQRTASGRLVISGNISFPWTDDPAGLTGWTMSGIYPEEMAQTIYDDSEGFWIVKDRYRWPVGLCEGSFFQTDDRTLHMLLRSGTSYLWVTESRDDGISWSPPEPTDFTDNGTKFHFGRLPDGRFYYVGCPDPEPRGARFPLVLSLSDDGLSFDRHYILGDAHYERRFEGLHKGGQYGYPHTLVRNGHLYVIVSRMKEAVQVIRADIAQLR